MMLHTRPDGVGEAQRAGADAVHVVVEDMVPFAGHLVDAVDVDGADGVVFIHGQIVGFAVNLPRSGEYDADARIGVPAGFEDGKLRLAVDVQIRIRSAIESIWLVCPARLNRKSCPFTSVFMLWGSRTSEILTLRRDS